MYWTEAITRHQPIMEVLRRDDAGENSASRLSNYEQANAIIRHNGLAVAK